MKKVLIGLAVVLIFLLASAYIFIPKMLRVSKVTLMHANVNVLSRHLSDENKWEKWWPIQKSSGDNRNFYSYNGVTYTISKLLYHEVEVNIMNETGAYPSKIMILPITPDSVAVKWETTFETSANPFIRFLKYQQAKAIRNNMEAILSNLRSFIENKENLYDYNVQLTTIKDTFLVATKIVTTHYPSPKEVYKLVDDLKKYISSEGAKETNYPMLNVATNDSVHYTTMVAIPADKELAGTGNISLKRMVIYKDKTVMASVKGGPEDIKKAYKQLDLYMQDYNLTSPVIHWESLITDRSKETDSSKWITKIFMPIV